MNNTLIDLNGTILKVQVINMHFYVTFMRPEVYDDYVLIPAKSMEVVLNPEDRAALIQALGGGVEACSEVSRDNR